jgi:hypothetical protein
MATIPVVLQASVLNRIRGNRMAKPPARSEY